MGKTKISWSDMTWPVVTGCSHAGRPGCDSCYAARMAATRLKHHPRYEGLATIENGKARWMGEVRLNHDVLEQPLRWRKPRRVFVASMGDLFHHLVPFTFHKELWTVMASCPQHCFQILTKRPRLMLQNVTDLVHLAGFDILPNVHLGVSVENQAAAKRIHWLLQTPAAVYYVSVEPCLSGVDLTKIRVSSMEILNALTGESMVPHSEPPKYSKLDWVICGGESGPGARPMHPDWARSLRNQCYAANTPFFFKQRGAWTWWDIGNPIPHASRHVFDDGLTVFRVGKKRAGHLLDGRTWQQFPAIAGALT